MKNVKYIALVLVVALALIGGTYAWWTDSLEIHTTAETGKVNMEFTSIAVWGAKVENVGGDKDPYMKGTHTNAFDGCKTATFTIKNMYPMKDDYEHRAILAMHQTNKGDIPLELEDVKVTFSPGSNKGIWEYVNAQVNASHWKINEDSGKWQQQGDTSKEKGKLVDLEELLKKAIGKRVIHPGERINLGKTAEEYAVDPNPEGSILIWLDESTPNKYQETEFGFDVELIWRQANLVGQGVD